jgi:hypothetical protein
VERARNVAEISTALKQDNGKFEVVPGDRFVSAATRPQSFQRVGKIWMRIAHYYFPFCLECLTPIRSSSA